MLDKGTLGYVKYMETLRGSTPVPKIGPPGGLGLSPSMLGFGAAFLNRPRQEVHRFGWLYLDESCM